jgi:Tfp pilus assembly PilM family ATPase/Tfp pilus assembly protein PilN
MPGKTLGLDITEDCVTAVQVKSELKGFLVTACTRIPLEPGEGLDRPLGVLMEEMDLSSDVYIGSIPETQISFRNVHLPFKDQKKVRQALPFEIESTVPVPIDDLVIDFVTYEDSEKSRILAASVHKTLVSEHLERLRAHGMDPDVLDVRCAPLVSWLVKQEGTPDHGLFLDIEEKYSTLILFLHRRIALIRSLPFDGSAIARAVFHEEQHPNDREPREAAQSSLRSFCTAVANTVLAFTANAMETPSPEKVFFSGIGALYPKTEALLTRFLEIPAEPVDIAKDKQVRMEADTARVWNPALMDPALALAVREGKRSQGFNFRRGEFEVQRQYWSLIKEFQKAAVLLGVIALFLLVSLGMDYYFLKKRHAALDRKMTEVLTQTFPDITRIVDPLQQMRVRIGDVEESASVMPMLRSDTKILDLIGEISQRIPKPLNIRVTTMVIDPESVRISGTTDTFNTVDSIKNNLEPSEFFDTVTISSANLDRTGKQVQFEIKLKRNLGMVGLGTKS